MCQGLNFTLKAGGTQQRNNTGRQQQFQYWNITLQCTRWLLSVAILLKPSVQKKKKSLPHLNKLDRP